MYFNLSLLSSITSLIYHFSTDENFIRADVCFPLNVKTQNVDKTTIYKDVARVVELDVFLCELVIITKGAIKI